MHSCMFEYDRALVLITNLHPLASMCCSRSTHPQQAAVHRRTAAADLP